jgi:L-iditol 2-dehydrogenase
MLLARSGAKIYTTDTIDRRLTLSLRFGAIESWNPRQIDVSTKIAAVTEGRGADLVIVAASAPGLVEHAIACSRPGARILLFAQTSENERIELSGASVCMGERTIFGCYSASVDLQAQSADLVFSGALPVEELISHRLPLENISTGFDMALHPDDQTLKIVVHPQRCA